MHSTTARPRFLLACALATGLLLAALPARAQWSNVPAIPATNVFAVWANADTIVAALDTVTYASTNAGASWVRSSRPAPAVVVIDALWFRNGRLYAGTAGQGVFVSDDLGATWQAFNQGLVGGVFDSQLFIADVEQRGDSLYVGTSGAGVYVRGLVPAESWHPFGDEFEPNQAANINDLALGGARLVASAGGNGTIFRRDPGEADWTISFLNNVGLAPGTQAREAAWNGSGWVVGTNKGVFRSVAGDNPWTLSGPGLGTLNHSAFATRGRLIFAAFDIPNLVVMEYSNDDGASWQLLEGLPFTFVFKLAVSGDQLFAARGDGLWVRGIGTVSVPRSDRGGSALHFALAGPQPVRESARLRFDLPEAGPVEIQVFDVGGRRVGERIEGSFGPGPHEVSWTAGSLSPGVYAARLSAGGEHGVVRLVHVR